MKNTIPESKVHYYVSMKEYTRDGLLKSSYLVPTINAVKSGLFALEHSVYWTFLNSLSDRFTFSGKWRESLNKDVTFLEDSEEQDDSSKFSKNVIQKPIKFDSKKMGMFYLRKDGTSAAFKFTDPEILCGLVSKTFENNTIGEIELNEKILST